MSPASVIIWDIHIAATMFSMILVSHNRMERKLSLGQHASGAPWNPSWKQQVSEKANHKGEEEGKVRVVT